MNMDVKEYKNTELNFIINAYIHNSGNPWFEGKELATLLGNKNTRNAIIKYVDPEDKITRRRGS